MKIMNCIVAIGALCASAPALAAADYLLKLEGVDGRPVIVEIQAWSWGVSNSGAAMSGSHGAGRSGHSHHDQPIPANGVLNVKAPRDAASGQASGRRITCPAGKHFPKATITSQRGSWVLGDVTVSACDAAGMTIAYGSSAPAPVPAPDSVKATKSRSNIQNN